MQGEEIRDVQVMGNAVVGWHEEALKTMFHVLQMPDNVSIDIPTGHTNEEGKEIFIDGNEDHKAGFLAGINYAIEVLETFPIRVRKEEEEE